MSGLRPVNDRTGEPDLREYLRTVWRRRRIVVLVVMAAVVAAVTASLLSHPVYESSATMVLQNQSQDPFDEGTVPVLNPDRIVQTEIQVFDSSAVRNRVRELIGDDPGVSVASLGQTNAFSVTARAPEADQAADIANAYAQAYTEVTREQQLASINDSADTLELKVADIKNQIAAIDAGPQNPASAAARDSLVSNQALFQQKLDELQVSATLQTGRATTSSPATPPGSPVSPKPIRSAVLAVVVGLILGLGTAMLLEYLDDSIPSRDALEAALGGVPVLGTIPLVGGRKRRAITAATLDAPSSPAAEAYRALRTSVQFLGLDREHTVVQVTSPSAGDGKTTTAVNLSVSLANAGQRVCLVSCDLRKPTVHEAFELDDSVGLTSVITGSTTLGAALQPVPEAPGLALLASGPLPPNPSEVLASRHMRDLIESLRAGFDFVILDCAPLLPVTDGVVLAPVADAVLIVARAGATRTHDLIRADDALRQVHVEVTGTVLNATTSDLGGYGYGYGYVKT
jgi:succinoglycan biosynthesis transport protein ExoP